MEQRKIACEKEHGAEGKNQEQNENLKGAQSTEK